MYEPTDNVWWWYYMPSLKMAGAYKNALSGPMLQWHRKTIVCRAFISHLFCDFTIKTQDRYVQKVTTLTQLHRWTQCLLLIPETGVYHTNETRLIIVHQSINLIQQICSLSEKGATRTSSFFNILLHSCRQEGLSSKYFFLFLHENM